MFGFSLSNPRCWFGAATLLLFGLALAWIFAPGLPVLFGPWASASTRALGQELFEHDWQPSDARAGGDGVGPVFNASSCVACHSQGGVGGGGDATHNVRTFAVLPTPGSPTVKGGVVHAAAIEPALQETADVVRTLYPVIKSARSVVNGCVVERADFDPLTFGEVNSTALFGAGWIDCISDQAIKSQRTRRLMASAARELMADFSAIPVGRVRQLPGGVGKFGWKGQAASLEEFVAGACANELGLGTPFQEQARPLHRPDYPSAAPDLDRKQFKGLVAFVATLPRPMETLLDDPADREQAVQGKKLFTSVGCAACHVPDLGGVKGVYSDFLLYSLEDENGGSSGEYGKPLPDLPLPDDHPRPNEWKTPALWGVADSAPYFHDGRSLTLRDALQRHRGDARGVLERFNALPTQDQQALVAFLTTLKAPPNAAPVARK